MAAKPPMVEFKNVSKIYPGGKVAVENINLRIERGEFVCFIGTSGGGKTTTLRMNQQYADTNQWRYFR